MTSSAPESSLHFSPRGETKVRERPVSMRRAPVDDPHLINEAYLDSTLSTATKRNEVVAGLWRASTVRW